VAANTVSAGAGEEQATERVREKARGWIAAILIGALVVIVVGTFVYAIWMSARIAEMTTDDLISVLQSIGTTLLAPLIGVIGAVIGFYFGGQAAVQGAQSATQAASQGAQQSTQAGAQTTQAVTQAAREMVGQTPTNEPGNPPPGV
jgi:ABC-type Fe3+ transport system permease subunit